MIRNMDYVRSLDPKLFEALTDIVKNMNSVASQVNGNPNGHPAAPPPINGVKVTGANGHFNVAISDQNEGIYRGVNYYVEHADNPQFTGAVVEHLGQTRNANFFLGNTTRYFRAYSAYESSPPGAPAYHGTAAEPIAVTGGGSIGGPEFLPSQASGTAFPNSGPSGPGPVPFRSATGVPPVR